MATLTLAQAACMDDERGTASSLLPTGIALTANMSAPTPGNGTARKQRVRIERWS